MNAVKISQMNLNNLQIVNKNILETDKQREVAEKIKSMFPNAVVSRLIVNKYGERVFFNYTDVESSVEFTSCWNVHVDSMTHNLVKMYLAFSADYDPTVNYDMKEEHYTGSKLSDAKTISTPMKDKLSSITSEATIDGSVKDVSKVESDTNTMTTETKIENHDTKTTTFDGNNTDGFDTLSKDELKRTGNIGVQTVPDMIAKELEIRFTEYVMDFIRNTVFDLTTMLYLGD